MREPHPAKPLAVLLLTLAWLTAGCLLAEPSPAPTPSASPTPASTLAAIPTPVVEAAGKTALHFLDLPYGDAILIDTPQDDVLIDGGSKAYSDALMRELERLGVSNLSVVIATHADEDHIGGLPSALARWPAAQVWSVDLPKDTVAYRTFAALADASNHSRPFRGWSRPLAPGVTLDVLAPQYPLRFPDANDNSLVTRLSVGSVSFLLVGDCEAACEAALLQAGPVASTVLKVGHHGSTSSSTPDFLAAVNASVAFISAGTVNAQKFGHPHAPTLAALARQGSTVFISRLNGTLTVSSDGRCWNATVPRGANRSECG